MPTKNYDFESDRREVERREHWPHEESCPISPVAAGRLLQQIKTIEGDMVNLDVKLTTLCAKTELLRTEIQAINTRLSGGVSFVNGVRTGALMVILLIAGAASLLVALITGKISISEVISQIH